MPESLNDIIRDLEVRHHVGIQRLSSGLVSDLLTLLDLSDNEIVAKLQSRGPTLEGTFTSIRLRYLLRAIREINRDTHVAFGQALREGLSELAKYEADFQVRLLQSAMRLDLDFISPPAQLLNTLVTNDPFNGELLRDMVASLRDSKYKRLRQAIQLGMIQGETLGQIVQRVRGTRALNYRDGVMNVSRTQAERLIRTATNHVANAAREATFEENKDIIKEVQAVATLDTRTCPRCAALDGQRFRLTDKKRPKFPLHLNCRCTWVPVTKSWRSLGIDIDELPPGERASMDGQVSATEIFNSWLRRQSAAVQDEALGPTRGALFRRGGLPINRFVDVRGNQLTLEELREREAQAFRRANVA